MQAQSGSGGAPIRCHCARGCRCSAPKFGPSHVGEYTLWLVGFSGKAWIPVQVITAKSWFDAREKGERLYPWVERGHLEASSGNRLGLFEQNAFESLARSAARWARQSAALSNAPNRPRAPTLTRFDSPSSSSHMGGFSSLPKHPSTPTSPLFGARLA